MPTTEQYLNQLVSDKSNLVNNLTTKGVEASTDETFTSLVPKVLDISGGGEPNIFIQTIEPEKKDGIWIKSDMTYSNVVIDEDIYNENIWKNEEYPVVAYNTSQQNATTFKYNGDLYLWFAGLNYGLYKYNPEASAFTKLNLTLISGEPKNALPYGGEGTIIDNYFVLYSPYNFGSVSDIVKINLDTLEITEELANLTGDTYGYGTYSTYYNGYFYEFGAQVQNTTNYNKLRKVNYSTRVSTLINSIPNMRGNTSGTPQINCARIENKVYIFHFGQNTTNGKWEYLDLETETFSQSYSLPSELCFNSNSTGWNVSVYPKGNIIYMLYNGVWKFDTATRTFTKITSSLPNSASIIKQSLITEYNGDLILISGNRTISGTTAWSKNVNKFRLTNKIYNNGDIIIRQGIGGYVLYNTALFDFDSTGKLMFPVSDVFLYNNNQLYTSLPTYIGDGTTWNLI